MSFTNKVVIVTGSSSGIGASAAIQFAKEGAYVTIVGRNEQKLKQVAEKISQVGKPALIVKADLTKDAEAEQIIKKTVEKFGKIDVLVNNAGSTIDLKVGADNFMEAFDFVINTNLRSVVFLTNLALPYLKQTKGNVISISSTASKFVVGSSVAIYSTSKAGLDQFTKNCASELAEFGVRANIISPGPVETNFFEAAGFKNMDFQFVADNFTALKVVTQPEEIANVILFVASDKARSITGADYVVDGGMLVKGHSLSHTNST